MFYVPPPLFQLNRTELQSLVMESALKNNLHKHGVTLSSLKVSVVGGFICSVLSNLAAYTNTCQESLQLPGTTLQNILCQLSIHQNAHNRFFFY